jgi:hypothetical protein
VKLPLATLVVAMGLRLGFGLFYWVDKPLTHDEREYLLLARNIATGQGFGYPPVDAERFGRAPIYPLFLAGIMTVTGAASPGRPANPADDVALLRSIKIAQALVGTAGVWLIGALAATAAGPAARRAALWIGAVYPPLVWICAYVFSEALYSMLALGSAILLGRAVDAPSVKDDRSGRSASAAVFGAGVLAGLSALTRPTALFFLALAAGWLLWRRHVRWVALFAIGAVLTVGPWTARNVHEYHRFVLIASEGGITFWTGNHPLARGEGDLAANPDIKRANVEFRKAHPRMSAEDLEPVYYAEAFRYIAAHPIAWLTLLVKKLFYVWIPTGPSYRLHSSRYYWASVLSYGALLPIALAGLVRIVCGQSRPRAMWLLAGSAVVACLVFFPQERFRIPVIDPILIACAAARLDRSNP